MTPVQQAKGLTSPDRKKRAKDLKEKKFLGKEALWQLSPYDGIFERREKDRWEAYLIKQIGKN